MDIFPSMEAQEIDEYLQVLLGGNLNYDKLRMFSPETVTKICDETIDFLRNEKMMVEVKSPCWVIGDLYGDRDNFLRMIGLMNLHEKKPKSGISSNRYIFLGNYVDVGFSGAEIVLALCLLKLRYPKNFYFLRGKHETIEVNSKHGFLTELGRFFFGFSQDVQLKLAYCSKQTGEELHRKFNELFNYLPLAAVIQNSVPCVHGCISPEMESLKSFEDIPKPLVDPSTSNLAMHTLWSDPDPNLSGFWSNKTRGFKGTLFGDDVIDMFQQNFKLPLILLGGQCFSEGYNFYGKNNGLLSIFSCSGFQGYRNAACVVRVNLGWTVWYGLRRMGFPSNPEPDGIIIRTPTELDTEEESPEQNGEENNEQEVQAEVVAEKAEEPLNENQEAKEAAPESFGQIVRDVVRDAFFSLFGYDLSGTTKKAEETVPIIVEAQVEVVEDHIENEEEGDVRRRNL